MNAIWHAGAIGVRVADPANETAHSWAARGGGALCSHGQIREHLPSHVHRGGTLIFLVTACSTFAGELNEGGNAIAAAATSEYSAITKVVFGAAAVVF